MESDTWCTPKWLAYLLGRFDLDPCSNPYSYIDSDGKYSLEDNTDGLFLPWWGKVFCNPPYSDPLPWAEKAVLESKSEVVFLLVNDVTPRWYSTLINNGGRPYPIRERVVFRNKTGRSKAPQWGCSLITLRCYLPERMREHVWSYEATRFSG